MTNFAVQYSFGVLHPYILAQSLSEPPPRPKNELLQPTLGFVPYGADLSFLCTLYLAFTRIYTRSIHLFLVVQMATLAFPFFHCWRYGMLRYFLRHPLFRYLAWKYIRNVVLSHLPAWIGHAGSDYSLRSVCRRRLKSEVPAFECFLSDNIPFCTSSYHSYIFLQ